MSLNKQKTFLFVLDVGHGSSAVLHDEGGIVVFDAGTGAHLERHLKKQAVKHVSIMILSHADSDHIGGAINVLLDKSLQIDEVLINSDSSKNTVVFQQLCYALVEANKRAGTKINGRLTTTAKIQRSGALIEVLHPPDIMALSGVGAKPKCGKAHTSNSMSAAVRVSYGQKSSVLLAADIEMDCLEYWDAEGLSPVAGVLVFPHHGGLTGSGAITDAVSFAFRLVQKVCPRTVIFSNHRTKHGNPRDEVVDAVCTANPTVRLACTQLPVRYHNLVASEERWEPHRSAAGFTDGSIRLELTGNEILLSFS